MEQNAWDAVLAQYQNPNVPAAVQQNPFVLQQFPQQMPQAQPMPAPQIGPTIENAKYLGSPNAETAARSGTVGRKDKEDKSGGMWESILEAFASGIASGGGAPPLPNINSTPVSVGQHAGAQVPGSLYSPTDFRSILAAYLR